MATNPSAASERLVPRRLPGWARLIVWAVRLLLLYGLYKLVRNPWPLLKSRVFPGLVLWISFSVYWAIAGRDSAADKIPEAKGSLWFHQIVLLLALVVLMAPVPYLTGWFLPEQIPYLVPAGAVVQAAFILLAAWARRHLGRNWSGAVRIGVNHHLIRTGPYRVVRHPIYTAMLGMCVGTAISSGQFHALVGLAMLFLAYMRKTRLEENILQGEFGAEYDSYRRNSWALVPFIY